MVNLICQEDCGNAPKRLLLKELITYFANGNISKIVERVADDVVWNWVGIGKIEGIRVYALALDETFKEFPPEELVIENILTHGSEAAANGLLTTKGGKSTAYCHVFSFANASASAKIKEITTYSIDIKTRVQDY